MHVDFPLTQSIDIVDELKKASQSARSKLRISVKRQEMRLWNQLGVLINCRISHFSVQVVGGPFWNRIRKNTKASSFVF